MKLRAEPDSYTPKRLRGTLGVALFAMGPLTVASSCSSREPSIFDDHLRGCSLDGGSEFVAENTFVEEVVTPTSASHTEAPYSHDGKPPAGGDHNACWGTWGVHAEPLAPERFIHNLEHGGIVLTYNCPDGCEVEKLWLESFASDNELVVVTKYPELATRFGLSAWNARAYSDCLDAAFVRDFYARRVDRGPERFSRPPPPPPLRCQ